MTGLSLAHYLAVSGAANLLVLACAVLRACRRAGAGREDGREEA